MRSIITVTHENIVVPPRCRKPRNAPAQSEIEVSVVEISASEAPVAMIVTTPKADDYFFRAHWGPSGEVRWYKGQLYTRLMNNYSSRGNEVSELTPVLAFRQAALNYSRDWPALSLDTITQRVNSYLDDLLFIDDEGWCTTDEPLYRVSSSYNWTSLEVQAGIDGSHVYDSFFRADELELARQAAITAATEHRNDNSLPLFVADDFDHIEVLIPGAVVFASCTKTGCCPKCGNQSQTYVVRTNSTTTWSINSCVGARPDLGSVLSSVSEDTQMIRCGNCTHERVADLLGV